MRSALLDLIQGLDAIQKLFDDPQNDKLYDKLQQSLETVCKLEKHPDFDVVRNFSGGMYLSKLLFFMVGMDYQAMAFLEERAGPAESNRIATARFVINSVGMMTLEIDQGPQWERYWRSPRVAGCPLEKVLYNELFFHLVEVE